MFAGLLSAWLAQRLIAAPLIKVVGEIRHVERFDLEKVERHPSRLSEIENLSSAIGDMAQGLAAFREIHSCRSGEAADRRWHRCAPRRRGAADERDVHRSAGFTGMSERLGDRIIPLLSRYFDAVSGRSRTRAAPSTSSSATP